MWGRARKIKAGSGVAGARSPGEPLRILHWYYLRELAISFLITFGLLFSVALLIAVGRWTYNSAGLDIFLVLGGVLLYSVENVHHLIPVALAISVVLTAGRAAADNEILAVRMGGIPVYHALLPSVLLGILLSSANAYLLSDVIPAVSHRKARVVADAASRFFKTTNPANNMINLPNFRMLWRTKEEDRFRDVWVDIRKTSKKDAKNVGLCGFAEEVEIRPPAAGKVRVSFRRFRGFHDPGAGAEGGAGAEVVSGFADQIGLEIDVAALALGKQKRVQLGDMSSRQIVAELATGRIWNADLALHRLHSRMCMAVAALFFALTGFPIGVLFQRGGRSAAFGIALLPLLVFYAMAYIGEAVATAAGRPVLGAWLPAAALALMAGALNWRVFRR